MLTERDIEMFGRIGVSPDLLEAAHVERVSDRDARERFGIQGPASRNMAGIVFPYYSHVTRRRVTARVRRDNPEIEKGRPKNKYVSAYGDARHLYFPPGAAEKLRKPDMAIALVEAEKSALAMTAWAFRVGMDLLPVAMGGCWCWRGRVGKAESANGSRVDLLGPLPDVDVCNGRNVYVCLDANAATNSMVTRAEKALVTLLAERGCEVRICRLPQLDGVNGPDDLIALHGDDAMRMVLSPRARSGDSVGILQAALEAISDEVYTSNLERFCAFCRALQRLRGPKPVALPVRDVGKLLELHHTLISQYRRRGVAAGWLQQVGKAVWHESGEPGRAATFRVKLPLPDDILTRESTTFLTKTIPMGKDSENPSSSFSEEVPPSRSEKTSEPLSEKSMTSRGGEKETTIVRNPHSEDSEIVVMNSVPELIQAVESAAGRFMVDGGCPGIAPGTAAASAMEELRKHKAEIIGSIQSRRIQPLDPAQWRKPFALWLDSSCIRNLRCSGGLRCLHIAFCEWECRRGGVPCTRDTFERLLEESYFLMGEVAGVVLVSGLVLREDLDADEHLQGPHTQPWPGGMHAGFGGINRPSMSRQGIVHGSNEWSAGRWKDEHEMQRENDGRQTMSSRCEQGRALPASRRPQCCRINGSKERPGTAYQGTARTGVR